MTPLLVSSLLFSISGWLFAVRIERFMKIATSLSREANLVVEALFGLALTGACGLLIALIVGFLIGKSLAR